MIFGAHVIVYSKDAAADRAFLRDVLGLSSVDAGHGWLIFALPPAEAAVHPAEENRRHKLYFMCDDLKAEIAALGKKGVACSDVEEADVVENGMAFGLHGKGRRLISLGALCNAARLC